MARRNDGLDFLKFIGAFMVICIHQQFPGKLGEVITPITRIAVPIFFMITGYYYSYIKDNAREKRQIHKMIWLLINANLLYFLYGFFMEIICNKKLLWEWLGLLFNGRTVLEFVFFNQSSLGGHLWYLGSILYVLIIIYYVDRKWSRTKLYRYIFILLLSDLLLGKYSLLVFGKTFPVIYVRNFLCVGLPYFLIGDVLSKNKIIVTKNKLRLCTVIFICTTLIEKLFLQMLNCNAPREHYVSTTFLAIVVFEVSLYYKNSTNKISEIICYIGSELSLYIYIIHPIIINILRSVMNNNKTVFYVYSWIAPFSVFLVSIIVSWGIHKIRKNYVLPWIKERWIKKDD